MTPTSWKTKNRGNLNIRRVIYTTNAIESLNMGLRKASKNRISFPSDDGVNKAILSGAAKFQLKMDDANKILESCA